MPFPEWPVLERPSDSDNTQKARPASDFWGAPSPDLTLSIHGLSPTFPSSPSLFLPAFDDDEAAQTPSAAHMKGNLSPLAQSPSLSPPPRGAVGFLGVQDERHSSYLSEGQSGTSGEDSSMDPKMMEELGKESRPARRESVRVEPSTSTPPRRTNPTSGAEVDIFGRELPHAPPMADPFALVLEPVTPPRKKSTFGSTKSAALVSLADSSRTGTSSQGYWDAYNITSSSQMGSTPPPPRSPSSSRYSLLVKRSEMGQSPPLTPLSPSTPTYASPLTPPLVSLPSFPPRSHSPAFDDRPRSRSDVSEYDEGSVWIARATVKPVSTRTEAHALASAPAADRSLPLDAPQQPRATARKGSVGRPVSPGLPYDSHPPPSAAISSFDSSSRPTSSALPSARSEAPSSPSSPAYTQASHRSPPPLTPAPYMPPFVSFFMYTPNLPAKTSGRFSRSDPSSPSTMSFTSPTKVSAIPSSRGVNLRQRTASVDRTASSQNTIELATLARTADLVKQRLLAEHGMDRRSRGRKEDFSSRPLRSETQGSRWWTLAAPSIRRSSSGAEGWSTLGEGSEHEYRSGRSPEERKVEREKRKVREARRKTQDWLSSTTESTNQRSRTSTRRWKRLHSTPRLKWIVLGVVVVLALAIALGVIIARRKSASEVAGACSCLNGGKTKTTTGGVCECSCPSEWGGTSCHLNSTCVGDDPSLLLAQGLLDVANTASRLFSPFLNLSRLPLIVNNYLATPAADKHCQRQLDLVTLPNLPISSFPKRLAWTEAALVWGLAYTEAKTGLRAFASALNFAPFGDDPATKPNSNYQMIVAGLTFDLATLASPNVPQTSWKARASPTADQAALVSTNASETLDPSMDGAWIRRQRFLNVFRTAVQDAEVLIPFDGATHLPSTTDSTLPYPLPIGCRTDLTNEQVRRVQEVEEGAFGLQSEGANATACSDRPLYGVVNLLRLRLPFPASDPRADLPAQAIVLSSDAKARCTIHAGETLVGASGGPPFTPIAPSTPDRFGTFLYLDHVLLHYLDLLPPDILAQLVTFVLSSPTGPPSPGSRLLSALPLLEVQLWGALSPAA